MKYSFIVLFIFDTVYCEAGVQPVNVERNNETVANLLGSKNELFYNNTTLAAKIQTRQNTVYATNESRNITNEASNITTKEASHIITKEGATTSNPSEHELKNDSPTEQNIPTEQNMLAENKNQHLQERDEISTITAIRQRDQQKRTFKNILPFFDAYRLINDRKHSTTTFKQFMDKYSARHQENLKRQDPIAVESLFLTVDNPIDDTKKTTPDFSAYVNFEVVDSQMSKDRKNEIKYNENELSNSTNETFLQYGNGNDIDLIRNKEIIPEDVHLSLEVTKNIQGEQQIEGNKKDDLHNGVIMRKPYKINEKSLYFQYPKKFRNEGIDPNTKKFRTMTKRQGKRPKRKSLFHTTDNWSPYLRSSSKTWYTKPYDLRAVNKNPKFRDRKLKNRKHSPKNKYEDSFEEHNAKFISKNVDISNSPYSLDNIDGPSTKNMKHKNQPLNSKEDIIILKAHESFSDFVTDKMYFKNELPVNDKSVGNLGRIDYEVETVADTNSYDEINRKMTKQYETRSINKPQKAISVSSNRMKQKIYKKPTMKHAPKWRKLIFASSYSDEEDVLIQNINKALKTSRQTRKKNIVF